MLDAGRNTLWPVVKHGDKSRETLAELISRARRDRGLSLKDVEERSGKQISGPYVAQIENGFPNPSTKKLRVLARVLRINEDEIFAAARGIKEPDGFTESMFWELFETYNQIESATDRELADHMLKGVARTLDGMPKKKDGSRRVEAVRKSR